MLAGTMLPVSVGAENTVEAARNKLISAWQTIAGESKIIKETLAVPRESFADVDGNMHGRIEVTESTQVAGAGITDVSVLGDYYVEYAKFGKDGKAIGWSYVPTLIPARNDIKLTEYNTVYMYFAAFDENKVQASYAYFGAQLNNGNSGDGSVELYSPYWKRLTFSVKADSIGNPKILANNCNITYVSFGSIIGEKTVHGPQLPENYEEMSIDGLILAAREVDYKGYPSTENFVEALDAATGVSGVLKQDLISVWQTLATESKHVKETLAVPGNFKDVDGNIHPQVAVTEDTKVAGNGLGNVSLLGDYYAEFVKFSNTGNALGWSYTPYLTPARSDIKLTEYDRIYMYFAAFDANKVQAPSGSVYVQLNNGNSGDGTVYFYSANWKAIEFTVKADSISSTKIICSGNNITYLSFGSLIGEKTVSGPALPENYEEMTLLELVKYTRHIDYEGFASSEAFSEVLEKILEVMAADIIKYDLEIAWKALAEDSVLVKELVAFPASAARIKIDENTVVDGLSNIDLLGGYYVDKYKWADGSAPGWSVPISHARITDGFNFSEYESVYFYLSAYDANNNPTAVTIATQTNNVNGEGASGTGWIKVPYSRENVGVTALKFVCTSGSITYVSYGSVIGERRVMGEALPEGYESMSLEELIDVAVDVDTEGFANGKDFEAALKKAKEYIGAIDVNIDAKNGNIAGKPESVYYGDKLTLSATANNGYKFGGWYSGEQMVSEDYDYSFTAQKINDIIAKFIAIKGDVNLDNKVDSSDLVGLRKVLLTDSEYTEHAYINEDTSVDIRDIVKLKKNLAEQLPEDYYFTSNSEAMSGENKEITEFKLLTTKPKEFDLVEFSLNVPNLPSDVNVYKESDVDISMTLSNAKGKDTVVDAFYFEEYELNEENRLISMPTGKKCFKLRIKPQTSGTHSFKVTLSVKGEKIDELSGYINVEENESGSDLLMVEPNRKQTFITASGKDYVAIGENVAWNSPNQNSFEFGKYIGEQMDILADNGGNHVRIWDNYYCGGRIRSKVHEMSQSASAMWDYVFDTAEDLGVYITFTLLNHGEISQSNTDKHFDSSCWHANNGGYITDSNLFFTDANTKAALKTYIRYIVSRWGYSENLMTWEICNEIDHGIGTNSTATVTSWLNEMAAYLREQDPYDHMVSNSPGKMNSPFAGLETFDFVYYHMYNYETSQSLVTDNVQNAIEFQKDKHELYDRPVLFGEWGVAGDYRETVGGSITEDLTIVHHGNWIGVMGGGAGTGLSWYWAELDAVGGQKEYRVISQVAKQIPWSDANMSMIETSSGVTVSNSKIKASGYKGTNYAYVWFYDKNYLAANRTETTFSGATGTVSIGNGTYKARWINTWTGECVKEETLTASNGKLSYTMPTWTKDVLLTVTVD